MGYFHHMVALGVNFTDVPAALDVDLEIIVVFFIQFLLKETTICP
jgi:hypothetical protein